MKRIKKKILSVLADGPMASGDLVAALGFSAEASLFDAQTRFSNMLKPLSGSFIESSEQAVLGDMVSSGEVRWRQAENMDNWYALPGQRFPCKERKRSLKSLVKEVLGIAGVKLRKKIEDFAGEKCKEIVSAIEKDDCWAEVGPFVIEKREEGWGLLDGDPICNWCGNTFDKDYLMDVEAAKIVRKMQSQLKSTMSVWGVG